MSMEAALCYYYRNSTLESQEALLKEKSAIWWNMCSFWVVLGETTASVDRDQVPAERAGAARSSAGNKLDTL